MLITTTTSAVTIQQGDGTVEIDATEALALLFRLANEMPSGPEMVRNLDAGTLTCPHCNHVHDDGTDAVTEIDASIRRNDGEYDAGQDTIYVSGADSNHQTVTYLATCCSKVVDIPAEVSVNFD